MYQELVKRVCRDVGCESTFALPPSYAAVRRAIEERLVDVAMACTGTYVRMVGGGQVKLLVQPEFEEGREYRAVMIVPIGSPAKTLEDLRGGVVAFVDPESYTGRMVPTVAFAERGWRVESFFSKVVFTGSHDRSIRAVAQGIVDVASVASLVWESAKRADPSVMERVRVIWAADPCGPPPFLVPADINKGIEQSLRKAFLGLDKDEDGRRLLHAIGIRRFVSPRPDDYKSALEVYRRFKTLAGNAQ
ncbi:MAG: phosphate/phosphite/phosphonate ABC transporter substrate-binding protein [Planctomycetes bacterium]|nr:phosphate/phosphite/phosphonate ABC transporter substrate-binding protein [Planctomycetota bacterium]